MSGRWTYTSVSYSYDEADKVVGYSGSIHAGWQDAPSFDTQDEYYAWAKRECSERNLIEAAAPELLEAANLAMEGIEIIDLLIASIEKHGNYSVESTLGFLNQGCCARLRLTEAIAKADGRSLANGGLRNGR